MGLRDRLKKQAGGPSRDELESKRFATYGVVDNPFPSASQTQGHPHMETEADNKIVNYVRVYDRNRSTQVLVIEGDQGTGKTNLLNYYEQQFKELYPESEGFYIIRYLADPEPGFDKMLARILQELGCVFVKKVGEAIADQQSDVDRDAIIDTARSSDMRIVLRSLGRAAREPEDSLDRTADAAIEWILGSRLLKRHREALGQIQFRLDTVESKTQALRDLVFCSAELNVLKGLILLLDELEKMDDTTSKMAVLRFLSAIRALIDALPQYLFLMAAMTPEARRRYFAMLPAFAGRLQNRIELPYLTDRETALKLYQFYLEAARKRAALKQGWKAAGARPVISDERVAAAFDEHFKAAQSRGDAGIRQRDFLNVLHQLAEDALNQV